MARVVHLHIGAPKTGTTYVQDRLRHNRAALATHGVHVPFGMTDSMFEAAIDLLGERHGGQDGRGEWDSLMARVRRCDGAVVVSQEILAAADRRQVERAMAGLRGAEVHVVYTARDLARQIPAAWQEGLKHQDVRSFATFLEAVRVAPRTDSPMRFWQVQSLPDVLLRWSRDLTPWRIHLVTVPAAEDSAPRDELWQRFSKALGIDPAWAPEHAVRENVSLGVAEAALVRRVNQRLRASGGLEREQHVRLVRELVVRQTLVHRPNVPRVTLPPDAYDWVEEVAEEWIQWVESSGIHVVGDLRDLRPVRPTDEGPRGDPDRPPPAAVLDAALEVIDVLVREAASTKREPLVEQARKLARFARRVRHH
jgi:hypothetical protein